MPRFIYRSQVMISRSPAPIDGELEVESDLAASACFSCLNLHLLCVCFVCGERWLAAGVSVAAAWLSSAQLSRRLRLAAHSSTRAPPPAHTLSQPARTNIFHSSTQAG